MALSDPRAARFRAARRLGRGGISEVLLAEHIADQRLVVVRRLLPHIRDNNRVRDAFVDESRKAAALDDPRVQGIEEVIVADGEVMVVSTYLRGESVRAIIDHFAEQNGSIPIPIVARIAMEAACGLHVAHTAPSGPVLHLDVRPSNIIVTYDGTVHVMDFGIRRTNPGGELTRAGSLKDRYAYTSHEQANEHPIGPHADIFQLGLMVFEMLTGRKAFAGASPADVLEQALSAIVAAPSTLRSDVSPELDTIVGALVSRDPDHRILEASKAVEAFERFFQDVERPSSRAVADWMREDVAELHQRRLHQERTALGRKSQVAVSDPGKIFLIESGTTPKQLGGSSSSSSRPEEPAPPLVETKPPNMALAVVLMVVLMALVGVSAYLLGAQSP